MDNVQPRLFVEGERSEGPKAEAVRDEANEGQRATEELWRGLKLLDNQCRAVDYLPLLVTRMIWMNHPNYNLHDTTYALFLGDIRHTLMQNDHHTTRKVARLAGTMNETIVCQALY